MSLTNTYLITTKNLEAFLNALQSARAPDKFTNTFLSQLDFTSSNDRLFLGLLKALGLLDDSGTPTKRYFEFLDQGQSARVLAEGIHEAYEDLFAVRKDAYKMSVEEVKNKLRTLTQGQKSEKVLGLMANTFKSLCDLADWQSPNRAVQDDAPVMERSDIPPVHPSEPLRSSADPLQLHYNIQIHLPESRDPAVFDAIFQALNRHIR